MGNRLTLAQEDFLEGLEVMIHGTIIYGNRRKFHDIMQQGLLPGGGTIAPGGVTARQAVHFSTYRGTMKPGGSECRNNCEMFIVLDWKLFLQEGKELYYTTNGVVMSYDPVPVQYWHTVVLGRSNHPQWVYRDAPNYGPHEGEDERKFYGWIHYLINEYNWIPYYGETQCEEDFPDLES